MVSFEATCTNCGEEEFVTVEYNVSREPAVKGGFYIEDVDWYPCPTCDHSFTYEKARELATQHYIESAESSIE